MTDLISFDLNVMEKTIEALLEMVKVVKDGEGYVSFWLHLSPGNSQDPMGSLTLASLC